MRFSQSFLEEVRDRIPISDVVGRRVTFDRKKSNPAKGDFWACCPFHGEKTPSFHCENQKGRYHCFGCGASGDHFRFMTELDGLSFPEAVERLADEAGIALPAPDPQAQAREQRKATLYDVMEVAAGFFRDQLQLTDGAKARAYLRDRGLSTEIQLTFGLGYAPSSRSALKEFLASKGVDKQQIEACGLVVHGPDIPVSYDRFRDRIMFPILDSRSRVIAFGGRALSADIPAKYLNSPETELFSKSNVLYNFARARKAVERGGNLIVAEGYMDVIALAAAGFANAVAPLGTALTEQQIALAWRVGGEPVLCFDGDEAGLRAAHRSIDTVLSKLEPGKSIRFALLPTGEDPDDLLQRAGAEAFQDVLDGARPLSDMLWARETGGRVFDTPERRAELERTLNGVLGQIGNESVKRHYQLDMKERLAAFFAPSSSVAGRTREGRERWKPKAPFGGAGYAARSPTRLAVSDSLANSSLVRSRAGLPGLRESALVATIVHHPAIGQAFFDEFSALEFSHEGLKQVHRALLDVLCLAGESGEELTVAGLDEKMRAAGHGEALDRLAAQIRNNRVWQALEDAAFEDARDGWKQAYDLHQRAHELRSELMDAERHLIERGDEASLDRLIALKEQLAHSEGTEALIEGFGLSSGRPARSF